MESKLSMICPDCGFCDDVVLSLSDNSGATDHSFIAIRAACPKCGIMMMTVNEQFAFIAKELVCREMYLLNGIPYVSRWDNDVERISGPTITIGGMKRSDLNTFADIYKDYIVSMHIGSEPFDIEVDISCSPFGIGENTLCITSCIPNDSDLHDKYCEDVCEHISNLTYAWLLSVKSLPRNSRTSLKQRSKLGLYQFVKFK